MFMVNHLIGFGAGSSALTETLVDRTTGTNIGDMTGGGGLAAAFDGTTAQAFLSAAFLSGGNGYVGKSYGAAKIYSKFIVYGSNDDGYDFTVDGTITITIYGKNGSPASATDGTSLGTTGSFSNNNDESSGRTIVSTDQSNSFTHVWAYVVSGTGGTSTCVAELEIYELI
jgi:hypothetical protein